MFFQKLLTTMKILIIFIGTTNCIDLDLIPETTKPVHYNLSLSIDMDALMFVGTVEIKINVLTSTNRISLNVKELNIDSRGVILKDSSGKLNPLWKVDNSLFEMIQFDFADTLERNNYYDLIIVFNGKIGSDLKGLYRSQYTDDDDDDDKRSIAVTYFAPNYARQLFPCYDEPKYKATFQVSVYHNNKYTALSNTPSIEVTNFHPMIRNTLLTIFDRTPVPMSTYLLAIILTDYEKVSNDDKTFNVYAKSDSIDSAKLALEWGQTSLQHIETYLNVSYPMAKMDFIAIEDLLSGAMENWGLITYRSLRLLYDDDYVNTLGYQNIHKIITHELAHQWFGNIATCSWWSHTWLNEGFATFFEDYVTSMLKPDWKLMDQFVVSSVQYAMSLDSNNDTRAMNSQVTNTDELSVIYTFVAYDKAASVIRMMEHIVSAEKFQEIMKSYMIDTYLSQSTPNILYANFEKHAAIPSLNISLLFASWTDNPGYPVINVKRNYSSSEIIVTQERFTSEGPSSSLSETSNFIVPLNWATSNNQFFEDTSPKRWLDSGINSTTVIVDESNPDWIIFNIQETGYYRVNYDDENWNALITILNSTKFENIHVVNRAQLIDDSYNLAKYGYLPFNVPLGLFTYLRHEKELVPFMSALPALDFMTKILRGYENYTEIEDYAQYIIRPIYKHIVTKSKLSHTEKLLRLNVIKYACRFGLNECLNYAKKNLDDYDLDERVGVYCGAAKASPLDAMKHMMKRWVKMTKNEAERYKNLEEVNELIDAIGCYDDEIVINGWITFSHVSDTNITVEDRRRMFTSIVQGSYMGTTAALAYLTTNYTELRTSYGSLQSIWITLANQITTEEQRDMFDGIVGSNQVNQTEEGDSIRMGKLLIADNLKWINDYGDEIFNWVEEYNENHYEDVEDDGGDGVVIKPYFSLIFITTLMLVWN